MKIDESTLRAFVDGELSPAERSRVEAVLGHDPQLAQQARAMQASRLPYHAAFDAQALPPMPAMLKTQLSALSAAAQAGSQTPGAPAGKARLQNRPWLGRFQLFGAAVGALGLAGVFAAGVVLGPVLMQSRFGDAVSDVIDKTKADAPWVHAIAAYQAMYVRETVDRATDGAEHTQAVLQRFQDREQAELSVPDLSSAGLQFKRIQLLAFEDRQLIQMAYLPAQGKPGALCVLRAGDLKDAPVKAQRLENLSIVTWQKDQLAYVLALDMPIDQALRVGENVAARRYPLMYHS